MASRRKRTPALRGTPVTEGVRLEVGTASACAVRTESRDIAVRVRQSNHIFRGALGWLPFVRGVLRFFGAVGDLVGGIHEAGALGPQQSLHGRGFARRFAGLFRTTPQTMAALGTALMLPLILAATMLGLPYLAERVLTRYWAMPRSVLNGLCCAVRVLAVPLAAALICRLKLLDRLCMYRGAMAKVINAVQTRGVDFTHEQAVLCSRLTGESDGAFVLLTLMLTVLCCGLLSPGMLLYGPVGRVAVLVGVSALLNEILRPLEKAPLGSIRSELRLPLMALQYVFTIEPHNQMIEVAICAWQAARQNDLSKR